MSLFPNDGSDRWGLVISHFAPPKKTSTRKDVSIQVPKEVFKIFISFKCSGNPVTPMHNSIPEKLADPWLLLRVLHVLHIVYCI